MTNPWLKKNPLMSLWLSGANATANRARGQATAAANKQGAAMIKQTTRSWAAAWFAAPKPKRRR